MKVLNLIFACSLVILTTVIVACTAGPLASPVAETKQTKEAAKPAPETWDTILAAAKKEGEVLVYSNVNPETRTLITKAFSDKYGLTLDILALSRGDEVMARAQQESKAGLFLADAFITGGTTLMFNMKPAGLLRPFEGAFILPEVLEAKNYKVGALPWTDKDKHVLDLIATSLPYITINTDKIKAGEITSFEDLAKPQYARNIVLADPTRPGAANGMFSLLSFYVWNTDKSLDLLRQMIKNEATVIRDLRLQMEWVARGRYGVGAGIDSKEMASFLSLGAPIAPVWPKEGSVYNTVGGNLALSRTSPHRNATRVFANWLLTKEGLTIFSKGFGHPSTRVDTPVEGLVHPALLPPPGLKIYPGGEEYTRVMSEMTKTSQQVMESIK